MRATTEQGRAIQRIQRGIGAQPGWKIRIGDKGSAEGDQIGPAPINRFAGALDSVPDGVGQGARVSPVSSITRHKPWGINRSNRHNARHPVDLELPIKFMIL